MIMASNRVLCSPASRNKRNAAMMPQSSIGTAFSLLIRAKRSGSLHHGHGNVP